VSFICLVGRLRGPRLSVVSDRLSSSVISCQSSVIGCQSSVSHKRTSMKRAQVNRGRHLTAVRILSNSNQKPGWSCFFSNFRQVVGATPASFQATSHCACAQSQPSHKHTHTTQTHIDSTSTNMKFSFVSFLAAVFSSPPSTPLFGESSSVMVRILCFSLRRSGEDDMATTQ
jgi:hypothetical protein